MFNMTTMFKSISTRNILIEIVFTCGKIPQVQDTSVCNSKCSHSLTTQWLLFNNHCSHDSAPPTRFTSLSWFALEHIHNIVVTTMATYIQPQIFCCLIACSNLILEKYNILLGFFIWLGISPTQIFYREGNMDLIKVVGHFLKT